MKHFEDFENVDLTTFEPDKLYTMPSGLQIKLQKTLDGLYWDGPENIVEPSGIMEPPFVIGDNEVLKEIFGRKELVIGDSNDLHLFFPNAAKNLRYHYYQVENYTYKDAFQEWKNREDVSDLKKGYSFCAVNLRGAKPMNTGKHVVKAYDEVRWTTFDEHPFIQLIFTVGTFGNLHIDRIEWEDVS